ncbi:MAG: hypothetical protein ACE15B_14690 [Bryobacteraceae bacterium]
MRTAVAFLFFCAGAGACDLGQYKPQPGLAAENSGGALRVTWQGERGQENRAAFREPGVVQELAVRKAGGPWAVLGRDLQPEFEITSGRRRMSNQQVGPLKKLGIPLTPELIEREKWNAFWDAPLSVPGLAGTNLDLPRRPEEIRRARASFQSAGCAVKTDGARLEIEFGGASAGIFAGRLRFTLYKGANLLRQELIAKTEEPSVAYKYQAGLNGFRTGGRLAWLDTARAWQEYAFGGAANKDAVALRARNRIAVLETQGGSLAFFPPPHKFFFAREIELNLGYVWYRQAEDGSFAVGVRQGDREEMYRPYGVSDELWKRRSEQSRHFALANFALYNAPPGTWQRMPVYFYLSAADAPATHAAVLEYTHGDRFKPLPNRQVAISHFHTHFAEQLADAGTLDLQPTWMPVFRALGVNIAMMSDFHSDSHPKDPGPIRLREQNTYYEGCRRHSDRNFLIVPSEEPNAYFGGHYTMLLPNAVYWTQVRQPGQPFKERHPQYGTVYHVGSAEDELAMLREVGGLVWQAHPRAKSSTAYPDAIRETAPFRSEQFLGGAFQSIPVDLSESRLCEKRCFSVLDDMNNWGGPKYLLAEGDTYMKYPEDETYPQLLVNYVKLDRVPRFDEGWAPLVKALRAGDYFVTSGEVLIRDSAVERNAISAEIEWTFPLEFVEAVWSDGDKVERSVVPAASQPPFGSHRFRIPFKEGAKWVRFAAWDSAGNGAFTQPVHLK